MSLVEGMLAATVRRGQTCLFSNRSEQSQPCLAWTSMARPLAAVSCIFLLATGTAHAINIGIKIKIGNTTIIDGNTDVPVGGGSIGVEVSPIPGESTVTVGDKPIIPTIDDVTSHLVKAETKDLGQIAGNIISEAGVGYANLEQETKKGLTNIDTNLRKAGGDVERTVRQAGGDAARELKAAQREVEGAATATYRYSVRQAEGSVETLRQAERRFREGKVIDAVWHLGLQPVQNSSDNAAQAALESSIVATAMSTAASTYGGPGGAAAYATWLAYYQTGGDANAALRVGLISAIKAYGTQAAPDPATAGLSETFKHAAVGGAMSGLAVAAAGGSPEEIQKTMIATAGSILVQDGYRSLSQNASVAEFTKAARQVYCLKSAVERSDDASCPSLKDYVTDADGRIAMLDTSGNVQYVDVAKEIPGADWLLLSKQEAMAKAADIAGINLDQLPVKEIDEKVKAAVLAANKVKGANIIALMDDRWALSYEPARAVSQLEAAVAPSVLLSYTGISPAQVAADATKVLDASLPTQPQEIVSCTKGESIERIWVAKGKESQDLRCVVGQEIDGTVGAAWYAKNDGNYCQPRMLEMAKTLMTKGYSCAGR